MTCCWAEIRTYHLPENERMNVYCVMPQALEAKDEAAKVTQKGTSVRCAKLKHFVLNQNKNKLESFQKI